jgi:hypothetical protein
MITGVKVKRWRQKINNIQEWVSVMKEAKFLKGSKGQGD